MQKQLQEIVRNQVFSCFLRAGRPCRKEAPKMTSRRLSGTLPGTLWEPPGTPWEAQDDPKRRQERPKKAPGAAPGRPGASPRGLRGGSGSRFGAQGPPRGLRGAIWEPFLVDFEAFLLVFSTPRRLILNRSGDMFPICLLAVFRKFWTLRGSIFQPLGVQFLEPVRTRFRMIQGVGLQRKFGKPRDDPHSNRPSARA